MTTAERKFATILFVDLSGYTELSSRLDPEDVVALVHPVMTGLTDLVSAHNGVVTYTAGDGFMAVYGIPATSADDAASALATAIEAHELLRRHNSSARLPLPGLHAGVAAGEILVDRNNSGGWLVTGRAVNLAARLCDAAEAGEVLVDPVAADLVGGDRWRRRVLTLKGLGDIEARVAPHVSVDLADHLAVYVDRDAELAALDDALAKVRATNSPLSVAVVGEAGIGKSALVSRWLMRVSAGVARFSVGGLATPLTVLSRAVLGPSDLDSLAGELSAAEVANPARGAERLRALTTGDPPGSDAAEDFALLQRLVRHRAAEHPVVLVLEDRHHAPRSLDDVLGRFGEELFDVPLLLVMTSRDAVAAAELTIEVGPLPDEHARRLAAEIAGGRVADGAVSHAVSRAHGHPLFLTQTVRHLAESAPAEPDALPGSVRMLLGARLDALAPSDKRLVQVLSAVPRSASVSALQQVDPVTVEQTSLDGLARRGILSREPDGSWRCAHDLLKDVAYAALPRAVRGQLHRRFLETSPADAGLNRAHHALAWLRMTDATAEPEARPALTAALSEVAARAASMLRHDAVSALALLDDLSPYLDRGAEVAPGLCGRVHALRAECLLHQGMLDDAAKEADAGARLVATPEERIDALLTRAAVLSRQRRYDAARTLIDEVLAELEGRPDAVRQARALALAGETWRDVMWPRYTAAIADAYDALSRAGLAADAAPHAQHMAYLSTVAKAPVFRRWHQRAVEATSADDTRGQCWIALASALRAHETADMSTAGRAATDALALASSCGDSSVILDASLILIESATTMGQLDQALARRRDLLEHARRSSNVRARYVTGCSSALAMLRSGEARACDDELAELDRLATSLGDTERLSLNIARCDVLLDRGEWQQAADIAGRALTDAAEIAPLVEVGLRLRLARALVASGRPPTTSYIDHLRRVAVEAEAPALAVAAEIMRALASPSEATVASARAAGTPTGAWPAMLADAAAFASGQASDWAAAAREWSRFGMTVWLARAQTRAGRAEAARTTLEAIDASAQATDWALNPTSGAPAAQHT